MFTTMISGRNALALCTLINVLAFVSGAAGQGTPKGHYAAGLVETASYRFYMNEKLYAHDGDNRGFGPEHDLARDNIVELFERYGLEMTLHPFLWDAQEYYNVVGELKGTTRPSQIYVVGGHFDSRNNPGADDNASAVATLLEIARLAGEWESDATIRLISFDREEQGLIGSKAYVADHLDNDFRGMISLDMIAYSGPDPDKAHIRGRAQSDPLKIAVAQAVVDYAGLDPTVQGALDRSDHAPFEWAGFQALWLAEYNYIERNPHYHKQTDSVDTPNYIDYEYGAKITRAVLGWLVDAAGLDPPHPLGDLNCNYAVDFGDINPFILALTDPRQYEKQYPDCSILNGDINGDGKLDFGDINPFVALLSR